MSGTADKQFLSLMAIGDAFGMKYEFVNRANDITVSDLQYGPHPSFKEYQAAHYTDDTQMSLANAELLLRYKNMPDKITDDIIISHWLAAFERDPRRGYSEYMYQVMQDAKDPADFKSRIDAKRGTTAGAAMRAAPFGFIDDLQILKSLTTQQARITHNTPDGVNSALAIAMTVHYLRLGGDLKNLRAYLNKHLGAEWNSHAHNNNTPANNGVRIATQAIDAIVNAESYTEILINAVNDNNASDTDTICALAMVMASQSSQVKNDLPPHLKFNLENGKYGSDFLFRFDRHFIEHFKLQNPNTKHAPRP